MDKELRSLRLSQQPPIPAKEMVLVVRRLYPKFDKPLLSKCEHGDEYGIQIRSDAMDALLEHFTPETPEAPADGSAPPLKKRSSKHRLSCRISCRLEDDTYNLLQQLAKADHYTTMQDWISAQVRRYIAEKRGAV